ncbi:MAG TPA: SpoIID/LytB domain-containing protein [Candidatus Copromonas faecavium]|uniref:SpoIID/LytB domain-containing protein n=1 Tax=Candidatus Copromonas faecavium (nom. illeg.) TaxID=2840740 RepID=A0A9D1D4E1_9FIRM|nr:SpoIID/LytB domain-containing protein [Candidatus Copromonas faecavium]
MDDGKKLINWVAGVATLIVALLIVIVVLEPREGGVSRAAASRAVALTIAPKDEIEENGPEQSFFPEELQNEWYVKYMDFLYEQGYLDPDTCPATEETALSEVTYGELAGFAAAVRETAEQGTEALQVYENTSHSDRQVSREDFWEFYDVFRSAADQEGNVKELTTDLYGTPDNVDGAAPWTAYTKDGRYLFEGLSLDSYIDKTIRFLVRDQDILKVDAVVSDEIVYENAWISGFSGNSVTIFIGNIQREFPVRGVLRNEEEISGQIGDLYLENGTPVRLVLKTERITGTVLAVRDEEIEIEGYGNIPLAENFKIYRTYGVLREQQKDDILVGYHMQEFVVADGEICAALTTERPEIDNIRVLLMTDQFASLFHSEITLSCDTMAVLEYGDEQDRKTQSVAAGESVTIRTGDSRLEGGRIVFRSANEGGMITVESLTRAQGTPVYPGHMEITSEEDGLLLLNEVDLEEYLKRVVPSEMPPTYEIEALKAQAICARTYAWRQIQGSAYSEYGAHVDDSTNFQVYSNTNVFETTNAAVNETFGQLLAYNGTPIETFYYSTSAGHSTDGSVWGADPSQTPYLRAVSINDAGQTMDLTSNETFSKFIMDLDADAYDSDFAMFRWNTVTTSEILAEKIGGVGRITGLTVTERGPGGIARGLKVVGTEGSKTFSGQSQIRSILGNTALVYNRKDGSTYTGWDTLPSAFIYIENSGTDEKQVTSFTIYGGGYGHGAGMSQNAAQGMAQEGKTCAEILNFFYQGCEVLDIGDVS